VFVVGEQAGVAPEHSAFVLHWAHRPPGAQTGAAELFALHCASSEQATQAFAALSQMGLSAVAHWVSSIQATQRLFTQEGVAPMHWAFSRQATHLLLPGSQTGNVAVVQ
jgi:hypothetical protein